MGKLVRDNSVRTLRLPTQSEDEYLPYSGYEHIVPIFQTLSYMNDSCYQHIWPYIGFYCHKCYYPIIMKANIMIDLSLAESDTVELYDRNISIYKIYNFECPECHHANEYDYYLDPAITPAIAKLNQKGYITEFSCQGHNTDHVNDSEDCSTREVFMDDASNSGAYIAFNNYWMEEVIDNIPLFGPWMGERNPDWVSCYEEDDEDPIKYTIRCPVLHNNLAERVVALDAWVSCLPDISSGDVFRPDKHINQKILDKRKNMVLPILKKD